MRIALVSTAFVGLLLIVASFLSGLDVFIGFVRGVVQHGSTKYLYLRTRPLPYYGTNLSKDVLFLEEIQGVLACLCLGKIFVYTMDGVEIFTIAQNTTFSLIATNLPDKNNPFAFDYIQSGRFIVLNPTSEGKSQTPLVYSKGTLSYGEFVKIKKRGSLITVIHQRSNRIANLVVLNRL